MALRTRGGYYVLGPADDSIDDPRIAAANDNANRRVLKSGDTMTGLLDPNGGIGSALAWIDRTIGVGGALPFTTDFNRLPRVLVAYVKTGTTWRQLPTSPSTSGIDVYVRNVTLTGFEVFNNSASAQTVNVYAS